MKGTTAIITKTVKRKTMKLELLKFESINGKGNKLMKTSKNKLRKWWEQGYTEGN